MLIQAISRPRASNYESCHMCTKWVPCVLAPYTSSQCGKCAPNVRSFCHQSCAMVPCVQASHGFAHSSKWAPRVGAFLNLESTGSGGPDVVFQHSGHWTISTYAASALYPRGSVIGQVRCGMVCCLSRINMTASSSRYGAVWCSIVWHAASALYPRGSIIGQVGDGRICRILW